MQIAAKSVSGTLTPQAALGEALASTAALAKDILQAGFGNLKKGTQNSLSRDLTLVDIAGVAWSDILSGLSDERAERATGKKAMVLFRSLDAKWFTAWMTDSERSLISVSPTGPVAITLSPELAASIADELDVEVDEHLITFAGDLLGQVPARAEKIYSSIPEVQIEQTKQMMSEALREVRGDNRRTQTLQKLTRLAEVLVAKRVADVFGRTKFPEGEPPETSLSQSYVEPKAKRTHHRSVATQPIQEVLRQFLEAPAQSFAILHAPFGFGKSLSVRAFAASVASDWLHSGSEWFPVVVHCPDVLSGHVGTLSAALSVVLEASSDGLEFAALAKETKVLVVLDGFDEVHQDEAAAKGWFGEIRKFCGDGSNRKVICASRPTAFRNQWLDCERDVEVEVLPFERAQIAEWIEKNAAHLGAPSLSVEKAITILGEELASTPILLFMAAYGWQEILPSAGAVSPGETGLSRTELYSRFLDRVSTGKWSGVSVTHRQIAYTVETLSLIAGPTAFQSALAMVAWEHTKNDQQDESENAALPVRVIEELLEQRFQGIGAAQVKEVTRSICLSMFLKKTEGESVFFSHRSFREFLTARYLASELEEYSKNKNRSRLVFVLSELRLKEAELDFLVGLLVGSDPRSASALAIDLDGIATESGLLIYPLKLSFNESDSGGRTTARLQHVHERSRMVSWNATVCALAVRGIEGSRIPLDALLTQGAMRSVGPGRLSRYRFVTARTLRSRVRRAVEGVAIDTLTGELAAIQPASELKFYLSLCDAAPSLFPGVTYSDSDYFASNLPALQGEVESLDHRLGSVVQWLQALPRLDALSATHDGVEPVYAKQGLLFPFARESEGKLPTRLDRRQLRRLIVNSVASETTAIQDLSSWDFKPLEEILVLAARLEELDERQIERLASIYRSYLEFVETVSSRQAPKD
jgi:hypothetical protein